MTVTPDTAGFAAAQLRLREQLGVDAAFQIPGTDTWPAGTPLDPETNKPYDPFLDPETAGADTVVTIRCSFVHRPFTPGLWGGLDTPATPIGVVDRGIAGLIITPEQYAQVANATRVVIGPETWDIELFRHDTLASLARVLVYLEHA